MFFKELNILTSYTLEATFYGCDSKEPIVQFVKSDQDEKKGTIEANLQALFERDGIHINDEDLVDVGYNFCKAIHSITNSKVFRKKLLNEDVLGIKNAVVGTKGLHGGSDVFGGPAKKPVDDFMGSRATNLKVVSSANRPSLFNQRKGNNNVI